MDDRLGTAPFAPAYFAHGRLLYRYPGSDAQRFSPRLAYRLIDAASRGHKEAVLWDPFCGAGLIPALAAAFFGDRFRAFVVSDVLPQAVHCARKNLALLSDPAQAHKRLREIRGWMGRNPKSKRRWGQVAAYLETLIPYIERNSLQAHRLLALCCPAAHLPPGLSGPLHIIADLPYGLSSQLQGEEDQAALVTALRRAYPEAALTMVSASAELVAPGGSVQRGRGGRRVLRWTGSKP